MDNPNENQTNQAEDNNEKDNTKVVESPASSTSSTSRTDMSDLVSNRVLSPDGTLPIPVASSSPLPKPEAQCVFGPFVKTNVAQTQKAVHQVNDVTDNSNANNSSKQDDIQQHRDKTVHDLDKIAAEEDLITEVASIRDHERNMTATTTELSVSSTSNVNITDKPSVNEVADDNEENTVGIDESEDQDHVVQNLKSPAPAELAKSSSQTENFQAPRKRQVEIIEHEAGDTNSAKRAIDFEPSSTRSTKKKRISSTKRAGLVLSVSRINRRIKAGRYARRTGFTAGVYMAAVLEYLVAEVLELAGNCARYFRKHRIFPRCIQLTLLHDKELFSLTKGAIVPQGGVKPFIHPALQPIQYTMNVNADESTDQLPSTWTS